MRTPRMADITSPWKPTTHEKALKLLEKWGKATDALAEASGAPRDSFAAAEAIVQRALELLKAQEAKDATDWIAAHQAASTWLLGQKAPFHHAEDVKKGFDGTVEQLAEALDYLKNTKQLSWNLRAKGWMPSLPPAAQ